MSTSPAIDAEDDYLSISSLNDLLFCERRAALHLIEGLWADNQHTVSGTIDHQRAHAVRDSYHTSMRHVRGMRLVSHQLKMVGVADVVEFSQTSAADGIPDAIRVVPIEYKRGKRRRWDNDEVQLCAQAMCLEEMLGVTISRGAIFHVKSRARRDVEVDFALRTKTITAANRLHQLVASGITPLPIYHTKCQQCSLWNLCLPQAPRPIATASRYLQRLIADSECGSEGDS